jgi:hypothetical protein
MRTCLVANQSARGHVGGANLRRESCGKLQSLRKINASSPFSAHRESLWRFEQVGKLLRQLFHAHERKNPPAHRIVLVVQLDDGEVIDALEHQSLDRFIAR